MKALYSLLIAAAAGAAHAQAAPANASFPQTYVGVAAVAADNITAGGYRVDPKLFAGVELTPNLGVEAGYVHFDGRNHHYEGGGMVLDATAKGYGTYLAGKYTVPLNERFSAYGKLGVAYSERKYRNNIGMNFNYTDTGVYAGLGAQYRLNDKLAVTAEFEHFGKSKMSGAKADAWSLGLKYGF